MTTAATRPATQAPAQLDPPTLGQLPQAKLAQLDPQRTDKHGTPPPPRGVDFVADLPSHRLDFLPCEEADMSIESALRLGKRDVPPGPGRASPSTACCCVVQASWRRPGPAARPSSKSGSSTVPTRMSRRCCCRSHLRSGSARPCRTWR